MLQQCVAVMLCAFHKGWQHRRYKLFNVCNNLLCYKGAPHSLVEGHADLHVQQE